jgi:transketolase
MTLSDQGESEENRTFEASADTSAEAVAFSVRAKPSSRHLSIDEARIVAGKLRRHIVSMIGEAGSGHPGGSLSSVEIVTALYFNIMRYDPASPGWADRDRFILSKGHAAPLLYAVLAETGYISTDELSTLRKLGSCLQGHCDMRSTPGVEMSSGSLGQGLSFGVGVALAGRLDRRDYRVYVLLGDGECDEGQVWEAAMAAAHFRPEDYKPHSFKLDNLVAIVDHNGQQIDGLTRDVMNTDPLAEKWRAFGWHAIEVDGHDLSQLIAAFEESGRVKGRPTAILARTVKGKSVSFMENNLDFHGRALTPDEVSRALEELE